MTLPADTPKRTPALSVSTNLPDGCIAYRNGLVIPSGVTYDDWLKIGSALTPLAGSMMFLLGDWLAYGQEYYLDSVWGGRLPNDLYAKVAEDTGYDEGTLRDAKWVCSTANLPPPHDKLTFGHLKEIVGRSNEGQYDFWIDKSVATNPETGRQMTRKKLREELRKSKAVFRQEPHDSGTSSILESARQFSRDVLACSETKLWTSAMKRELLKILTPAVQVLSAP